MDSKVKQNGMILIWGQRIFCSPVLMDEMWEMHENASSNIYSYIQWYNVVSFQIVIYAATTRLNLLFLFACVSNRLPYENSLSKNTGGQANFNM